MTVKANRAADRTLSTAEFAERHHVRPQTVRAALSRRGSYFGVAPVVLASGRLAWPDIVVVAK